MRGAPNCQVDRYHSDHTIRGGGCTERRRNWRSRSGQLADYYPLIHQAISRLEPNTLEARQKVYEWARSAMVAQLWLMPGLAESDVARERMAIEKAITKVETENLRVSDLIQPFIPLPSRCSGPAQDVSDMRVAVINAAPLPLSPPVARNEESVADDPIFTPRPAAFSRDSSAELECLQNQIRDRRCSAPIVRKLIPIAIAALVFAAAAPYAY